MIATDNLMVASPIVLSVVTIILLIIYELGNKRIKKILLPFVVVFIISFLLTAILNVYLMLVE